MVDRNEIRGKVQEAAIESWFQHSCYGHAIITMGTGKSKIIADSINRYMDTHGKALPDDLDIPILILVNSQFLRDVELPAELEKWGCRYDVKIVCYQTAYRWQGKRIGLLLADELDFAISESSMYLKVFKHNRYYSWFGMTGSMIEKKTEIFKEVFTSPPFFTYSLKQAQEDGVLNKTKIILHEVPLTEEVYDESPYGEVSRYKWIAGKVAELSEQVSEIYEVLKNQRAYNSAYIAEMQDALRDIMPLKQYWESSNGNKNSRKMMLYSTKSTVDYARHLKNYLTTRDDFSKVLIFSEFTRQADDISENTYHGKSPKNNIIKRFNAGEIREMGVCKKVNRGVNFVGLNHAIVQSYSSSVTNALQGYIGRLVRLMADDVAYIHFLYSSYPNEDGGTSYCRNLDWIQSILSTQELEHLEVEYFKLENY